MRTQLLLLAQVTVCDFCFPEILSIFGVKYIMTGKQAFCMPNIKIQFSREII